MRLILASAALCLGLSACVTAGGGPTSPVTVQVPASILAAVKPYCGKLQAGAIGLPIFIAILRASGVNVPASASDDAALASSVISQVCGKAVARATLHRK
jgi:hypothetical protein